MQDVAIDGDRLWADLMALAALTDEGKPFTRRAFSPMFQKGRAFLQQSMSDIGLTTGIDVGGNLIGRREGLGQALGTIAVGSHSDTVPSGGRFDGIAGVIAGIAAARALHEAGWTSRHAIEIIDFLAEEPTDFGLSCVGSRVMSGALDDTMLAMTDGSGQRLGDALTLVGGDPSRATDARRTDLAGFFELHIEQGPVLETDRIDIGVVSGIAGIRRIEIAFDGEAAHAGTAPMHLRRDAGVAAAQTIGAVRRIAERLALAGDGYFVATVGIVEVAPGGSNVVPGHARIVIDARAQSTALIDRFTSEIDEQSLIAATTSRTNRSSFTILSDGVAAASDPTMLEMLRGAAADLGLSQVDMASGAGHDAAFLARVCPMAMLFVPSRGGISHNPDEWTDRDALVKGASVLLHAIIAADHRLS